MTFTVIPACPVAHLVPSLPNWSVYHIATSESCYIDVEMSLWVCMLSSRFSRLYHVLCITLLAFTFLQALIRRETMLRWT